MRADGVGGAPRVSHSPSDATTEMSRVGTGVSLLFLRSVAAWRAFAAHSAAACLVTPSKQASLHGTEAEGANISSGRAKPLGYRLAATALRRCSRTSISIICTFCHKVLLSPALNSQLKLHCRSPGVAHQALHSSVLAFITSRGYQVLDSGVSTAFLLV